MQTSILTQVLLPLVLALIMFGMGLTLKVADFSRLFKYPRIIVAGILGQILLLPIIALVVALVLELSAPLAVGLMIVAACPGGTTSNIFSHLARANLALSVTLTAISTLICVFSAPLVIQYSLNFFNQQGSVNFSLLETAAALFLVTLMPVVMGIVVRHKFSNWADKQASFFRRLSLGFLIVMIIAITIKEREALLNSLGVIFAATILLNVLGIFTGILLAKTLKAPFENVLTLAIEVGIQNASMAMLISVTLLNSPELAIAAGIYGLTMYLGTSGLVFWAKFKRQHQINVKSEKPLVHVSDD